MALTLEADFTLLFGILATALTLIAIFFARQGPAKGMWIAPQLSGVQAKAFSGSLLPVYDEARPSLQCIIFQDNVMLLAPGHPPRLLDFQGLGPRLLQYNKLPEKR
ncbi:hypothetical protein HII31_01172 [Pseudocercospora fuligena]|uniref:Uncharacterized protein n=1 Tax=Pseudocercospora fuligena TaxID=685502 RepID=A0A8H6RUX7_9PEZI|nr:hypothetical protein HII31_01172 [Pseudocercospora fuligena]